jgi:hypothetical protein
MLSQFEFVIVLLSIIVGLGLTELLTNLTRQIKNRDSVKTYWLHTGWVIVLFIALLQQWWESWDLQHVTDWTFPMLVHFLAGPIGLFMTSHLLFPDTVANVDFRQHYERISSATWLTASVAVIAASTFRAVSFGEALIDPGNASSLLLLIMFVTLAIFKSRKLHEWMFPVMMLSVVLDILIFKPNL